MACHKEAIGELLNAADPLRKKVISAYNPSDDVKHDANVKKINKTFDAAHLETAAQFLGFTVIKDSNDKKLYKNLSILADRIVLKIESYFTSHCDACDTDYRVHLSDIPLITCKLCLQGCHDCDEMTKRVKPYLELDNNSPLPGFAWLCHGCLANNDRSLFGSPEVFTGSGKTPVDNSKTNDEANRESSKTNVAELPVSSGQNSNHPPATQDICDAYVKRKCAHGLTGKRLVDGKPCPKRHPPRCFRFCENGDHSKMNKQGCRFGKDCKYLHGHGQKP